jgi:hypothetical protein
MAEIVNLRRVKKQRARADQAKVADANRALHGRTRTEKEADQRVKARREAVLDQARLESEGGDCKTRE